MFVSDICDFSFLILVNLIFPVRLWFGHEFENLPWDMDCRISFVLFWYAYQLFEFVLSFLFSFNFQRILFRMNDIPINVNMMQIMKIISE